MIKVSVIICTRNRFDDFTKTVLSLAKQTCQPDELIVVDSSDELTIERYLGSVQPPFPSRYFHTQPGLTLQRNFGIRKSSGEFLFFFDDDVELASNYIELVVKTFNTDVQKRIGAIGGRIMNFQTNSPLSIRVWIESKVFKSLRNLFGLVDLRDGRFRFSGMPTHPHLLLKSGYMECLSGCCMAFRRDAFEKISFDEKLPNYGLMEDADISKRALDAGYGIYYEASATLVHMESPRNRADQYRMAKMTVMNYAYLFHKNWNNNWYRKLAFYWAILGLIVVNLTKKDGLRGTLSGLANLNSQL